MSDMDEILSYVEYQETEMRKLQTNEQRVLEALCREVLKLSNKLSWIEPKVDNLWRNKK